MDNYKKICLKQNLRGFFYCLLFLFVVFVICLFFSNLSEGQELPKEFCFDSVQINKLDSLLDVKDYLEIENDSLIKQNKYLTKDNLIWINRVNKQEEKISNLNFVINNQELQINKLEKQTVSVIEEKKVSWYVWPLVFISGAAAGIITITLTK